MSKVQMLGASGNTSGTTTFTGSCKKFELLNQRDYCSHFPLNSYAQLLQNLAHHPGNHVWPMVPGTPIKPSSNGVGAPILLVAASHAAFGGQANAVQ